MGRRLTGEKPKPATIYMRRYRARLKRQAKNPNGGGDEWGTPPRYIALSLEVLGRIDFDPSSNAAAQLIVRARVYFTKETDGLRHEWHGTVFLNPPYSSGLVDDFVATLLAERESGRCTAAIVLVNSSTSAKWYRLLLRSAAAVCQVDHRIKFIGADGNSPGDPSRGQTFFYFGPDPERFASVFRQVGHTTVTRQLRAPPLATAAD
jgi:hypothetical protein